MDNIVLPALNELPPLSLDFILGLIDGDGSFNVSFNKIEEE